MAAKKPAGMGKAYGKMEKMIEGKDKEMGMKEGGKKDMKKDMAAMHKGKGMNVMIAVGMKKGKK
jgi:hypothetical protein